MERPDSENNTLAAHDKDSIRDQIAAEVGTRKEKTGALSNRSSRDGAPRGSRVTRSAHSRTGKSERPFSSCNLFSPRLLA